MKENLQILLKGLNRSERNEVVSFIEQLNRKRASDIAIGETFFVGDIEFIKLNEEFGKVIAVTKDTIGCCEFGLTNNLTKSCIMKKLNRFGERVIDIVGSANLSYFTTDLTAMDGTDECGSLYAKVGLPTIDCYRRYRRIFDKYRIKNWWWLGTPMNRKDFYVACIMPNGDLGMSDYDDTDIGVRPLCVFNSSIYVS